MQKKFLVPIASETSSFFDGFSSKRYSYSSCILDNNELQNISSMTTRTPFYLLRKPQKYNKIQKCNESLLSILTIRPAARATSRVPGANGRCRGIPDVGVCSVQDCARDAGIPRFCHGCFPPVCQHLFHAFHVLAVHPGVSNRSLSATRARS